MSAKWVLPLVALALVGWSVWSVFGSQAEKGEARIACAVRSGLLRSNGRLPQPGQKVGMPPSLFWMLRSHSRPSPIPAPSRSRLAHSPLDLSPSLPPHRRGVQRTQTLKTLVLM